MVLGTRGSMEREVKRESFRKGEGFVYTDSFKFGSENRKGKDLLHT